MTNLEKYLDKILESGTRFAVNKDTLELTTCNDIRCIECLFYPNWADSTCSADALYWLFEEAD